VDSSQIWHGTMGTIDKDSATTNSSSNSFGMMDASGDSQTSSSTYPFYVNLDSSDGLMLGQHVYIENDEGQEDQKAGLWLSEVYISDTDTDQPYVWAMGKDKKLEKRSVILGQYDEELGEYEIVDGLTKDDYIAYPAENLKEGMATTKNREEAVESDNVDMEPVSDMSSDELPADDNMDSIDYGYDGTDDTMISDYDAGDMTDDSEEMTDGDLPDEDLVPIQDDTEAE
jgi:HlyD family secretion protein